MNATGQWQWTEGERGQRRALVIGVIGLATSTLGATWDLDQFFRSYLTAFVRGWRFRWAAWHCG